MVIGRRLVSAKTFEMQIAPSIADLQVEGAAGPVVRWRHYVGIITVLFHALLQEVRVEIAFTCDVEAIRSAWKRAALWFAGFALLLTGLGLKYNLPAGLSLRESWGEALTSTGLDAVLTAIVAGMMALALYLTRKACSFRSVLLLTLLIAGLQTSIAVTVRPIRLEADRTLYAKVPSSHAGKGTERNLGLFDPDVTWWQDIQNGVQAISFGLLGILLARRRGWGVLLGIVAYWASFMLVAVVSFQNWRSSSLVAEGWINVGINFAALLLLYLVDRVPERFAIQSRE